MRTFWRAFVLLVLTVLVAGACDTKTVELGATPVANTDDARPTTEGDKPSEPTVPSSTSPDPGPSNAFVSGGTSFGFCVGFCTTDVTFDADKVTVTLSTREQTSDHVITGDLTNAGKARLAEVAAELATTEFEETYGCPDCADGGSAWVVITRDDVAAAKSTYEFSAPPVELADADAMLASLIETFRTCTANELVTLDDSCTPPPDVEPPTVEGVSIIGAGTSFGECAGFCKTDVIFDEGQITLTASTWNGEQPDHVITGTLTEEGFTELTAIGNTLTDAELEVTYGCPDCADGGAAEIVLAGADGSRITATYEYANAPAELVDTDRFVSSVIETLRACGANDSVESHADCKPLS